MFAVSNERALRWVRISAFYDLVVTAPFATPWTLVLLHQWMVQIDAVLQAPGEMPAIGLLGTLFANLMGSVVLVWSYARLRYTTIALGRLDAVARGLFATWQIYAVTQGASALLLVFTCAEIFFLIMQTRPVKVSAGSPS